MRILMTGHRGYIGTVAVPLFQAAGHEVEGLDSDIYERCTFGDSLGPAGDIPWKRKDIRDVTPADFAAYDAVLHLAALSNDPLGNLDPDLTYDINHRGTMRVATAAKEAGVPRFVFSSSCSNYGTAGDDMIDEGGALNPVTPYGKSKVMAEHDLLPLADAGFCVVNLRSATACGVSPRLRFDLVLNNLLAYAFTVGEVFLKSDGTPWRPIVHIEDISRAMLAVIEADGSAVQKQAFNVGRTTENYQMKDLAEIVVETVPGSRIAYAADAGPDLRCYRVDCSKIAAAVPAFQPQWTAGKTAQELHAAYRQHGLGKDEFEGPRYQRIAHVKSLIADGTLGKDLRFSRDAIAAA